MLNKRIISVKQTKQIINGTTLNPVILEDESNGQCYTRVYDGEGTIQFIDGGKYTGQLQNGFIHGKGTYVWQDGTKITMKFNFNRFDGKATYFYLSKHQLHRRQCLRRRCSQWLEERLWSLHFQNLHLQRYSNLFRIKTHPQDTTKMDSNRAKESLQTTNTRFMKAILKMIKKMDLES